MKTFRYFSALCLLAAPLFGDDPIVSTVKLSKPGSPSTVRISVGQGSVKVLAQDSADTVTVSTEAKPEQEEPRRPDGLRVLSSGGGSFSLTEKDNVVELNYGGDMGPATPSEDFVITVPRNAAIQVTNSWMADVDISDVQGDVEVRTLQGEVRLKNLGGGAVVETMNGEIEASFTTIAQDKPLAFTSMNGQIKLQIPEEARANVRFRTQNGSILTDFEENRLKTKSEPTQGTPKKQSEAERIARDAAREAARVAREVAAEVRDAVQEVSSDDHPPRSPRPPRPPSIPSMVGGKVVSGALNGGGTEIQAATMNGDIVVRKKS